MKAAFWDSSALVPLCVQQQASGAARGWSEQYACVVWWGTPVEMRSAFERIARAGQFALTERVEAEVRLELLRRSWREIQPSTELRRHAEGFLAQHVLRAADSLQLAAAWMWCGGDARKCVFLSGDAQLLQAARLIGFETPGS